MAKNVIRLLDQKLHCFKIKLYFSNFLNFTIVKKIVKIYWKKLKIQILTKSDVYIAQHRSTRHLKALILQFNATKFLLTFSQHLLTKNVLSPEQAYFGLQFGHVCFWRSLVSQQVLTKCWNFWKSISHHQGYLSIILKFLYDAYNLKYWFLKKFSFSFCSSTTFFGLEKLIMHIWTNLMGHRCKIAWKRHFWSPFCLVFSWK